MKECAISTKNINILQVVWNYVFFLRSCILNFVYSGKRRVFCQRNRVFCYIFVHSGTNIVHPATEYTKFSKSCIPEYAVVYSGNVVYSGKSSCILEKCCHLSHDLHVFTSCILEKRSCILNTLRF